MVKVRLLDALTSFAGAKRVSGKLSYLLFMPAGRGRHISLLARLRDLARPHSCPGLKSPIFKRTTGILLLLVIRIIAETTELSDKSSRGLELPSVLGSITSETSPEKHPRSSREKRMSV